MPDLEPITRDEKLWSGEDLEPITRREMYIKHLYDETQVIPDKPITREEMFILKAGEELHDVTIEQLTATENRTYSEEGVAYSPVIVNVPQTTLTTLDVTENGTYTAPSGTAYNEVDVDVPLPENAYLLKDIANTPASIATFTDGSDLPMPKLEIAVEPQQDLHGYDAPWVGGAGKNKLQNTATTQTISGVTYTVNADGTISLSGTASSSYSQIIIGNVTLPTGTYKISDALPLNVNYELYIAGVSGASTKYDKDKEFTITEEATDKTVFFYIAGGQNVNGLTLKPMIRLASVSDATFAPYSNECPISGWSAVDVGVVGKNLLNANTSYNVVANTTWINTPCDLPKGTYTFSYKPSSEDGQITFNVFNEQNERIYNIPSIANSSHKATFTINERASKISSYSNSALTISEIQIEIGSTATTYEPYNPNSKTITIQLGDTYYGGKLDVVSGVLTVDRVGVDLGDLNWTYSNGFFRTADLNSLIKKPVNNNTKVNAISSMYVAETWNAISSTNNGKFAVSVGTNDPLIVCNAEYTDATAFKTAMDGVQLVYELATPIEIQLSPTQVNSLMGVNNIWADCGDIIDGQYFGKEV